MRQCAYGITISDTQGGFTGTAYVDFVGSFAPFTFTAGDNTTFYLGTNNTLYYPTTARTMGACYMEKCFDGKNTLFPPF